MNVKFQSYSEYKDSGVEWLGQIPSHWDFIKLKYVADLEGEKIEPGSAHKYVGMENVESWSGKYTQKEDATPEGLSTSFIDGDVLFGKLRPYLAKSWLADFSGICSSEFLVLRSKKVSSKFLNYYSLTEEFIKQVDSSTYGSKMPRASWDFISLMEVPVPADRDSEKIANFLDHETAKIDTLIEKQQQLIALLKEKRQAVISYAVTKGLNANAPMRDSGVEWLGEVPEHWDVQRINLLFSENSERARTKDELEYPVLSISIHHGISDKELNEEESDRKLQRSEDRSLYKVVHSNYLAYNMMRAWQGGFGASKLSGLVSPAYVVCEPKTQLNSYYFELSLRTPNAVTELKRFSRGITDFRLRLYWDEFKNISVPVPPEKEVADILKSILDINSTYDNLGNVAEQQIKLLQERRTALISAAVTGKIDVRSWKQL
jgi:type I restriction enzyme S subunit